MVQVLLGVILIVLVGVLILQTTARRQQLKRWASTHWLGFDSRHQNLDVIDLFPWFRPFQGYAGNIISGRWRGRKTVAFDFCCAKDSLDLIGRRLAQDRRFSAVVIASPIALKPLQIRLKVILDRAAASLGVEGIKFESFEFSEKFFVQSPDRKWASDVLHPRAMELLLSHPVFRIEFARTHAIIYGMKLFPPRRFGEAADILCGLFDLLPEYVIQQQGRLKDDVDAPSPGDSALRLKGGW